MAGLWMLPEEVDSPGAVLSSTLLVLECTFNPPGLYSAGRAATNEREGRADEDGTASEKLQIPLPFMLPKPMVEVFGLWSLALD
jgi:hypothetical protein